MAETTWPSSTPAASPELATPAAKRTTSPAENRRKSLITSNLAANLNSSRFATICLPQFKSRKPTNPAPHAHDRPCGHQTETRRQRNQQPHGHEARRSRYRRLESRVLGSQDQPGHPSGDGTASRRKNASWSLWGISAAGRKQDATGLPLRVHFVGCHTHQGNPPKSRVNAPCGEFVYSQRTMRI